MKQTITRLLKTYKRFVAIFFVFFVWIVFFDNRSMLVQRKLNHQIRVLENEEITYTQKLEKVKKEWASMQQYPEKYAREKYFMHKPDETVYLYVDEIKE
ncbi:MAG TPA: septum formation initiator [Saprospirales bacterium]|nr:septum formation initiator [Saprospirales bacterium]HRQ29321.1 septum formation initiator family protein [Saprospiraceae bacterium]